MVCFLLKLDASQKACIELFSADLSSNAVSCHALSCAHALGEAPGGASVAVFFLVLFSGHLSCPNIWCHDLRFHFLGLLQTAPSKVFALCCPVFYFFVMAFPVHWFFQRQKPLTVLFVVI